MEKVILPLLDLLKPLYRLANIDFDQLRSILSVKIKMDNRRQTSLQRKKQGEESNYAFLIMLITYSVFSVFIGLAIIASQFMFGVTIFFSYLMVMMAVTLITDFSSILLDTSDNTIILPRPVDSKTMYVARVTHIFIYLGQLAISLSVFPCIALIYQYGFILLIPAIIAIILSCLMSVFLTNAIYLLIIRFASEQKIKSVINYFQIGMAIVLMGGYQIVPRLLSRFNYQSSVFEIHWWSYLVPPIWLSGSLEMLIKPQFDIAHLVFIVLSISAPLAAIYVTTKWLSPFYNKKLLSMNSAIQISRDDTGKTKKPLLRISRIAAWVTNSNTEQGAFAFIYKLLGRDHKLKLKIYPSFGFILVFGFILIFNGKKDLATIFAELPATSIHVALLYLPLMIFQTAWHEMAFSEDFKASWIYLSTPLENPGEILLGMLKSVFIKLFLPAYSLISIGILIIWGSSTIDDVVFGLVNNFMITIIVVLISSKYLPLSVPPNAKAQSGNLIRGLFTLVGMAVPGLIHYAMSRSELPLLWIAIPIQFVIILWLMKRYRNTSWTQIKI